MYEYNCIIERVVDGDTIDITVDLGFQVHLIKQRVRVHGINTPETRTKDLEEKRFGMLAKEAVERIFPEGSKAKLVSKKFTTGKFGRILGDFYLPNGQLLTEHLLETHLAAEYTDDASLRVMRMKHNFEILTEALDMDEILDKEEEDE
jgi:micrococcal nuclease